MSRGPPRLALLLLFPAGAARAHHGVASGGFAAAEGPGAAIETTSALPLPEGGLLLLAKEEYARFRHLDRAEPVNKDHFSPEKESLDELADWHFSLWASATAPLGSTSRRDARGDPFEPEMQTGFGAPSATVGAAALKQLAPALTVLADASHQRFLPHTYDFTRHQFGAETRANAGAAWRVLARPGLRLDLVGELNGIRLERDREREPGAAGLEPLRASGGSILYMGLGARAGLGRLGVAFGVKRAVATALNEGSEQQGSEGLEGFRATAAVTWAMGL